MRASPDRFRVLLLAPTALDWQGRPITQRRLYLPALTLPHLAAGTPDDCEVTLVSESVQPIPYGEPWDLVGLTAMGSGIARAWQIADEFRRRGRTVVLGGIAAGLLPPERSLPHVDAVVTGDADEIWPGVVRDAQAGRLRATYRAERRPSLDDLPVPRYDLMDRSRHGLWRPVQAARGCPFTCDYCSITAYFDGLYRKRPVAQVVRDVREAKRVSSRFIAFVDDNIAVDFDYCGALFEALVPERIVWMSQASLHIADRPDILALAHRSGCRVLSIGFESLTAANMARHGKPFNRPAEYAEAIRRIRAHGIEVSTEMIVGMDEDDPTVFDRTWAFLMDNRIPVPRVHILTPIPGTPLWERMEREGRLLLDDLGKFSGGRVVFRPRAFEPDDLLRRYWGLYERLFTPRAIVHRVWRNDARVPPFIRGILWAINLHYRHHIGRRITPGLV
jgi:radical SAM superfamily enzyme YgiQ (UPF0313 family)